MDLFCPGLGHVLWEKWSPWLAEERPWAGGEGANSFFEDQREGVRPAFWEGGLDREWRPRPWRPGGREVPGSGFDASER